MATIPSPAAGHPPPGFHLRQNYLLSVVGASLEQILPYEPQRIMWAIFNLHATQSLYLGWDDEVTATRCVYVGPAGASAIVLAREDGILSALPVNALASGAGTEVYTLEVIADEPIDFLQIMLGTHP